MEWETDRSLRLRMVATLAIIAVMPMVFVASTSVALNYVLGLPGDGIALTPGQFGVVFLLTLVGMGLAYAFGGRRVLESTGAGALPEDVERDLTARLQRLAGAVNVPTPGVAGIDTDVPNAYATGRSRESATIVVTRGLVEQLDGDELDAVLAHELAHVKNRDAMVMSIVYLVPTFSFLVSVVTYRLTKGFFAALAHSRPSQSRDWRALLALVVLVTITAVVTITISAVFWLASSALFMLLSQYREHAADRGAAAITGDPAALASALTTIDDRMQDLPDRDLRELDGGAEALYISSLDIAMFGDEDDIASTLLSQELFPDSHPPTAERVERLRDLAGEMAS